MFNTYLVYIIVYFHAGNGWKSRQIHEFLLGMCQVGTELHTLKGYSSDIKRYVLKKSANSFGIPDTFDT